MSLFFHFNKIPFLEIALLFPHNGTPPPRQKLHAVLESELQQNYLQRISLFNGQPIF